MLQADLYLNSKPEKLKLEFKLHGESIAIFISKADYLLSKSKPIKSGKFYIYKDKIYLDNPLEDSSDLGQYDMFVDRKEDKLDTEPKTWEEYIGQEGWKATIKETIKAVLLEKSFPYPHILVSGSAGLGKSALIGLLAKQSGLPLIETIAGNLETSQDVYKLLEKLNKTFPYSILFIDEIHGLKKEIAELLLPALQKFKVNNRPIPYFTLAGATTDLGLLTKKVSPLVDRCKQKIKLEPYTIDELTLIISNLASRKSININREALVEIASRSRQTPRYAIGYLENLQYHAIASSLSTIKREVAITKLESLGIYEEGITNQDIILLEYLARQTKPVGQNTLIQKLNTDKDTYLYNIEPFLLRNDYINKTPRGRIIEDKGREYLQRRNK